METPLVHAMNLCYTTVVFEKLQSDRNLVKGGLGSESEYLICVWNQH
jgi:hypothetical protein